MLIQEVLEMAETVKECRNNSKFCDVETENAHLLFKGNREVLMRSAGKNVKR